jgi:hypothetical protein
MKWGRSGGEGLAEEGVVGLENEKVVDVSSAHLGGLLVAVILVL